MLTFQSTKTKIEKADSNKQIFWAKNAVYSNFSNKIKQPFPFFNSLLSIRIEFEITDDIDGVLPASPKVESIRQDFMIS